MRVVLEVVEGPLRGRKIALRSPIVVTVGRTERSDYVLELDPEISSLHLQLDCQKDVCLLRDLDSSNGTWVNDQRVTRVELHHGDRIRIGQSFLLVNMSVEQASESAPLPAEVLSNRPQDTHAESAVDTTIEPDPQTPSLTLHEIPTRSTRVVALKVESEVDPGRTFWLRAGQHITFGRTERADVVLPQDALLSAIHFAVAFDGQRCEIQDLDSRNGIRVNGVPVRVAELNDGDEVTAGRTTIRVTEPGKETDASEPRPKSRPSEFVGPSAVPAQSWPPYRTGLADADTEVRRHALLAAAWRREPWLLGYCQTALGQSPPDWEAAYLLSVLATDHQANGLIDRLAQMTETRRFRLLGALGHPQGLPMILQAMADPDVRQASAAATAFAKITGIDVASSGRKPLPAEAPEAPPLGDDFDDEFLEEVPLPDPEPAARYWQANEQRYRQATRWCRGLDVSQGFEALEALDLESRFETLLREHFLGKRALKAAQVFGFAARSPS